MYLMHHSTVNTNRSRWTCMLEVFLFWEVYVLGEATKLHVIHTDGSRPPPRRRIMQSLTWSQGSWSMAHCISDSDCSSFGYRMICIEEECGCDTANVLIENNLAERGCYPKVNLFQTCASSEQCSVMNRNTYCNRNSRCTCSPGYYFDGRDCIMRYDTSLKAQEVYKAAVVAAACFIVAVVGIFVACIVRRSFCRRDSNVQHASSSSSDVFSVSDEIAALRAVDKPPSYEEVLQIERTFYGIPPPEYSVTGESTLTCNQNTIAICEISNPICDNPNFIHEPSDEAAGSSTSTSTNTAENATDPCDGNDSISSTASPLAQVQNIVNLSRISPQFPNPTAPQRSLRVLGLPLSASAPSSPSVATHMPHPPTKRSFLQRLSSLRLHSRRPASPSESRSPRDLQPSSISITSDTPNVVVTGSEEDVPPCLQLDNNLGVAYDNPAYIDEQK